MGTHAISLISVACVCFLGTFAKAEATLIQEQTSTLNREIPRSQAQISRRSLLRYANNKLSIFELESEEPTNHDESEGTKRTYGPVHPINITEGAFAQVAEEPCEDNPKVTHVDVVTVKASVRCCRIETDCSSAPADGSGFCQKTVHCASGLIENREDSFGNVKTVRRCFPRSVSWAEAHSLCSSVGQQLPETLEQVQSGCDTGCRSNEANVWFGGADSLPLTPLWDLCNFSLYVSMFTFQLLQKKSCNPLGHRFSITGQQLRKPFGLILSLIMKGELSNRPVRAYPFHLPGTFNETDGVNNRRLPHKVS
eukprot:1186388-Prorocentrum_minimum.AAC.3